MMPKTNHEHSQLQTLNNSRIALTLYIEKGQHIYGNYYSARIKLSNESKDLLYKNLSKEVKFDSLDKYVELSPKSFYIYSRDNNEKKGWHDELFVRDASGIKSLKGNIPLHRGDSNKITIQLLYDDLSGTCSVIYDDLLSPNSTLCILDKLLNNENNISTRDICLNLLKESEQQSSNNYIDYNHIFASNPKYENTNLHIAVYTNDLEQAKHLIKEGSDIYVRNKANHSPLSIAFGARQIEMLKILFESSHFINDESSFKSTIRTKSRELVELLINKGMNINSNGSDEQSPVRIAGRNNDSEMILYLISKGANFTNLDLAFTDEYGNTPLHHATQKGDIDMVKLLVEKGSQLCTANKLGETPLTYAKKLGNEEIEHYISDRISSTLKDEIENSKVVIFKLVKFDNEQASITLKLNNESKSAFFPHGSKDVVINMPVNGLFINKDQALCARLPERFNESSLIWENLDDVFFVINLSNYNTRSNLATGLYKMLNGHSNFSLNSYQYLPISNYVDYDEMYRILCTTLPKISLFERFNDSIHYLPHEIVRLIKNGVIDLEKDIDMYGETLLHHAVVQGNINLFNTLIEQSPSMVNAKDSNGLTPLNMAVHFNRTEMIERLKEVSIKYSKEESISMKKEEQIVEINSEKQNDKHTERENKKRSIEENEDVEFLQKQTSNNQENKNLIEKNENIEFNSDQGTIASNLKVEANNLQEVKHSIWNVFESIGSFIYTFFSNIISWFKGAPQENIEIRTDYQSIDNNFVKTDENTTSKILEADQNLHHDNDLI